MDSRAKKQYFIFIPFLMILILLLFQYRNSFPQGDDFLFSVEGGSLRKIGAYYGFYYFDKGSRMANLLAQILLLWDLNVWKILTPMVICGSSLLFFYYTRGYLFPGKRESAHTPASDFCLASVCAVFPGFIPLTHNIYGDTFIWMDGSCNYLYPLFLMTAGFVPFYNTLRGRGVPVFFKYASPVCLCVSGLLHEQTALLIFGMCLTAFLYLRREKAMTPYLRALFILSLLTAGYTLSCPGAYRRLCLAEEQNGFNGIEGMLFQNLPIYFGNLFNSCVFWTLLLGFCALYLLHDTAIGGKRIYTFYSFYLMVGAAVFAAAKTLRLPTVQEKQIHLDPQTVLLLAYWLLFLVICFIVLLTAAHTEKKYRYLPVLFVGIWSSQGIAMAVGSWGRPVLPLIWIVFLMAVSLFQGIKSRYRSSVQLSIAAVGLFSMVVTAGIVLQNHHAYQDILRQVDGVRNGTSDTVVFEMEKFNTEYMYFNSFTAFYSQNIVDYYHLPENTKIEFIT